MNVRVKFVEGFKDGNIFGSRKFAAGEFAILTEVEVTKVRSSGGLFEVIEHVIPNPRKQVVLEEKPVDFRNLDNSINDIESHVPGYEEVLPEERVSELKKKAKSKK